MLVFDEEEQYINLITNGFEKYPNKRDLVILCNHWLRENELSQEELKARMIDFCWKHNSQFNVAKSEGLIINVLNSLNKPNSFSFNNEIKITNNEIQALKRIENIKEQKIAFVMICLAKWRNANFIYLNQGSSIKISDLFKLAEINASKKEQYKILHKLNEQGDIDVQLKPILKCMIPCIVNEDIVIEFSINNNLILEWEKYFMPHCEKCGKPLTKTSNRQKYCADCAKKIKNEQIKSYRLHNLEK